jgi:hypothetical protein
MLKFRLCGAAISSLQAAADGRATTMPNRGKALQYPIDQINRRRLNKPNRADQLGKPGVHQY